MLLSAQLNHGYRHPAENVTADSELRGHHHSRLALLLSLLLLFSVMIGTAHAQTLTVTSNGSSVNSGGTLYIDNSPLMPPLSLEVTGVCGTVNYTVNVQWNSTSGDGTSDSLSGNFPCGQIQAIDWTQFFSLEGGTADIQWSVTESNGTTTGNQTFNFTILGENPCYSDVDSFAQFPWFFRYILMQESSYLQFSAAANCPSQSGGYPSFGAPDGFGLGKLEAPNRFSGDDDFWNWPINELDSATVLENAQPSAYSFWSRQVSEAGSGNPPPSQNFPNCQFSGSPSGAQQGWQDAEWITGYNGTGGSSFYAPGYYIVWTGTNPSNGVWKYNVSSTGRSYVGDVCSYSPVL